MTTPLRAAIYVRVSTTGQEDNYSLSTQDAACRAYATQHGYDIVAAEREVHTGRNCGNGHASPRYANSSAGTR
jgi:DNA invertase Pin-like site-specific DNA recombinase